MGSLLWCNSMPETAVTIWPYRDSWAPAYMLACGNWVSGHENHRPGFSSGTHPSTSAEAHACTLSNRKRAPLQRCSFWTVCDLHWQREGNERRAYFSSLPARPVLHDVWESEAGQFLLTLKLLSMCFAYGHTPLASPRLASVWLQETTPRTLVVQSWTIQIQMLCYLEVAWGRIEQLRGCEVLSIVQPGS